MRVKYKIIWVEDEPDDMEVKIRDIESELHKNAFIPIGLKSPYPSYEDFEKNVLTNFDATMFNDCDLLLIDNNISAENNDKHSGGALIAQLRKQGVYTDTLFYSGAISEYRSNVLDNVFYSGTGEEFSEKFKAILDKQMNQAMNIANIRGYLMDSTSDFDFISKIAAEYYFKNLSGEEKNLVLDKIKEKIEEQKSKEVTKFTKIAKKYANDKLVVVAFDAMEYAITVEDKFEIFALIMKLSNKLSADKTDMFTDGHYRENIIAHRNKLAHSKLYYGENDKSHIKIAKSLEELNCDCASCKNKYTLTECQEIRQKIYEYYRLFEEVEENIKRHIAGGGLRKKH
jgi:hypothetical protein